MTTHLEAALSRMGQGEEPRDWDRFDQTDTGPEMASDYSWRHPPSIEPQQTMPRRPQDEASVLKPQGRIRRVQLEGAEGPWTDGRTNLEQTHGDPDDEYGPKSLSGGTHEATQQRTAATEPVGSFPRVLQAGGADRAAEVLLRPDVSFLHGVARHLVQAGLSFEVAAARFRAETGLGLTKPVFARLAHAEGLAYLVEEARYPRSSCGRCGMIYATRGTLLLCPSCRSHRTAALDVVTSDRPGAYDNTESQYRRDLDQIQVDHGTNKDEPRRYLPASWRPGV